jgi:hypothetical protein
METRLILGCIEDILYVPVTRQQKGTETRPFHKLLCLIEPGSITLSCHVLVGLFLVILRLSTINTTRPIIRAMIPLMARIPPITRPPNKLRLS